MKKRGFTLIEMLIVIIIIGILAASVMPRIGNARDRAYDTARVADIRSIATALISYQLENSSFPDAQDTSELNVLLGASYGLGGIIPTDPQNEEPYSYKALDDGSHFILCAKLSSHSTAGNAERDYAEQISLTTTKNPIDPGDLGSRFPGFNQDNGDDGNDGSTTPTRQGSDVTKQKNDDKQAKDLPQLESKPINVETFEEALSVLEDSGSCYCFVY